MVENIDFIKIVEDIDMHYILRKEYAESDESDDYYYHEYHEYYDYDDHYDIPAPLNDYGIPEFLMEGYEPRSVKHYGNISRLSDVNLPKIININGVEYVQIN